MRSEDDDLVGTSSDLGFGNVFHRTTKEELTAYCKMVQVHQAFGHFGSKSLCDHLPNNLPEYLETCQFALQG